MLPIETLFTIDKKSPEPAYRQLYRQIIQLITESRLIPGSKLPSTRELASALHLNRMTILKALEELESQGWVEKRPRKGIFVSANLPVTKAQPLGKNMNIRERGSERTGFKVSTKNHIPQHSTGVYRHKIDEGLPDVRLAPLKELGQNYKRILLNPAYSTSLGYGPPLGDPLLREELSCFLNGSRGLGTKPENIAVLRGSHMALNLLSKVLICPGDKVAVGSSNYLGADVAFLDACAKLKRIPVDEEGLDADYFKRLCEKENIRGLYLTPHHHHPTTVTLSADRRLKILEIANRFGIFIIEDDYDYDFHYGHGPYLPLASMDRGGNVIYIGSFTKSLAPTFRVGYMVAPKNLIDRIEQERVLTDRQGDLILERTIAELIKEGVIQQHLRKSLRIYQKRRDLMAEILTQDFAEFLQFEIPSGGMSIWAEAVNDLDLELVSARMIKRYGWWIPDYKKFNAFGLNHREGIRLGFASLNEKEMRVGLGYLLKCSRG
ncbi:GntR family transcriptional regulator (plasmid) [Fulvitalea axinellae]|uniref:GntR family transcriptional regulator n=1 Tax=Fulvitalea axinellae TaxID=1182444 RepID=A0AAU9CP32_9BACT|nr:GntR family transcriptional regulator [Fulvitalea axinellae]